MASKSKVTAGAKLPPVKLLPADHVLQYALKEAEATDAAFSIIELLIDRGVRQIIEKDYEKRAIEQTAVQAVEAILAAVDQRTLHLKRDRGEVFNSRGTSWFDTAGHEWECEPEPMRCPIDRLARQAIEKIEAPQRVKAPSPPLDSRLSSPNNHLRHRSAVAKSRSSHAVSSQTQKRGSLTSQPIPVPAPYPLPIQQPSPRDEAARIALLNVLRSQQAERVRLASEANQAATLALQNKQAEDRNQLQLASQRRQAARAQVKKASSPKSSSHPHQLSADMSLTQTVNQPNTELPRRGTVVEHDKPSVAKHDVATVEQSKHSKDKLELAKKLSDSRKFIKHKSSVVEEQKHQIIASPSITTSVNEIHPSSPASIKSPLTRTSSTLPFAVEAQSTKQPADQPTVNSVTSVPAERKQPPMRSKPSLGSAVSPAAAQVVAPTDTLSSLQSQSLSTQSSPLSFAAEQIAEQSAKLQPSRTTAKPFNGKKSGKKAGEPRDDYTGPAALLESIIAAMVPASGVTLTYESDTRAGPEIPSTASTAHISIPIEDDGWDRAVASLSLSQYRNWQEQRLPRPINQSPSPSQTQTLPIQPSPAHDTSSNFRPPTALFVPDNESYEEIKEQLVSPASRQSIVVQSRPPPPNAHGRKLSFDSMMLQSTNWGQRQSVPSTNNKSGGVILPLIHNRIHQGEYEQPKKDKHVVVTAPSRNKLKLSTHLSEPAVSKSRPVTPGEVIPTELGATWLNGTSDRR